MLPSIILGYHGCDKSLATALASGSVSSIKPSNNDYDWLGTGQYFWEGSSARALDWASSMVGRPRKAGPPILVPAVIGAVIKPGNCLNLLDHGSIQALKNSYQLIVAQAKISGTEVPRNTNPKQQAGSPDRIYRRLDCKVIELVHHQMQEAREPAFDTVRAVFLEGAPVYDEAGFLEKTHIQVCVRNPASVIGYFRPRDLAS
jgi:hypothetical protein